MEERRHPRVVVDRPAACRSFNGEEQALVDNLSPGGCMVVLERGGFYQGQTLLLTLAGGAEVSGEVVWKRGPHCGIKFTTLLPQALVSDLAINTPTVATIRAGGAVSATTVHVSPGASANA